jgi:hypothetical protein
MEVVPGRTLIRNQGIPGDVGTVTCLCRDEADPDRRLILTCAHVVAPPGVNAGLIVEAVDKNNNQSLSVIGHIAAASTPLDQIDVAVIELRANVAANGSIDSLGMPAGVSNLLWKGVKIEAACGMTGVKPDLVIGETLPSVDLPYMEGQKLCAWTYHAQIACPQFTQGGDSGSVVVNQGRFLVGMVVGATADGLTLITPIKDLIEFIRERKAIKLVPVTAAPAAPALTSTQSAATAPAVGATASPGVPAAAPANNVAAPAATAGAAPWTGASRRNAPASSTTRTPAQAQEIFAFTLWAEAAVDWATASKGLPHIGNLSPYLAVAEAIVNRVDKKLRGTTVDEVCLSPLQFSCWNGENPDGPTMRGEAKDKVRKLASFKAADYVASHVLNGWTSNLTRGATHYYANYIAVPKWAKGKLPCATIGQHLFFRDIP